MPEDVVVVVNEGPDIGAYLEQKPSWPESWRLMMADREARVADTYRVAFDFCPNESYYGIFDDDYWPVTPDWHRLMVEAAGPNGIALANNKVNFPKPYCCRVMGGDLARAIGTIAPGRMRHNYLDDAWAQFGADFGILRPLEHVVVEHHHHLFDKAVAKDETYTRGSGDIDEDHVRYQEWLGSTERLEQCRRVAELLGGAQVYWPSTTPPEIASPSIIPEQGPQSPGFSVVDLRKVRLAVLTPIGRSSVDIAYHQSYIRFMLFSIKHRLSFTTKNQCGGSHPGKARERLLWDAWRDHDPTHLMFIDDDMGWDERLPLRLIAADVDFAAVAGVRKQDKASYCCNFFLGHQEFHPVNGFLKVRDVGFAFVLLKRTVIERMIAAYPDLEYKAGESRTEHALFLDMIDERERLSEDLSFCRRWTAIGGEIWVDPTASLIHAGRKEYTGRIDDLIEGKRNVNMDIVWMG